MKETMLSDDLFYYFLDSVKIVSNEEALEMIHRYKENPNQELEFEIFKQYSKFIFKRAKKFICKDFNSSIYDISDLMQEGYLGFRVALEKYDINESNKFLTYASWWIDRYIKDFINRNRFVFSIPRPAAYELVNVAVYLNEASSEGKQISKNDVQDEFKQLSNKKCELYYNIIQPPILFDDVINDDINTTKIEFIIDDPDYSSFVSIVDRNERLEYLINRLCKKRDADMLRMYYGLAPYNKSHTSTAIGKKYNVTRQYVSANISKSVKKLHTRLEGKRESYDF